MTKVQAYAVGFSSLAEEITLDNVPSTGEVPRWLDGTFVAVGPGRFDVAGTEYAHWWDGLSMLHRFSFRSGQVAYANRFVESDAYRLAVETGQIARREFATIPNPKAFGRSRSLWNDMGTENDTDNGNSSVILEGGLISALTETRYYMQVDPHTLKTVKKKMSAPDIEGQVTTTHPKYDRVRNKLYSFRVQFGRISRYNIYSEDLATGEQTLLHSMVAMEPAYMHSFAVTENYIILTETPLIVKPLGLRMTKRAFSENYRWATDRPVRFFVLSKDDGKIVSVLETDPFFTFHHVNAYEDGNEVVLDLVAYPDSGILRQLYLDKVREAAPVTRAGKLRRFRIPLGEKRGTIPGVEIASGEALEGPHISEAAHEGRRYRFVYGAGIQIARPGSNFLETIVKVDMDTGASCVWRSNYCYPVEPIFVPAPGAREEDEGVLLSVVLDAQKRASCLLVLEAKNLTELARVHLPHHVPFALNAQYFPELKTAPERPEVRTSRHRAPTTGPVIAPVTR